MLHRPFLILGAGLAASLAAGACADPVAVVPQAVVDSASVSAGTHNVLSALVRVYGMGDSARVVFGPPGAGLDSATPAVALSGGAATVPVLGLVSQTAYEMRAVLYGGPDSARSSALALTTGALPADLPTYTASGPNPLPGYVVFGAGNYGLVIDNTGRIVWYRHFTSGPGLNFMSEPTGFYIGREAPGGGAPEYFLVLDAVGDSVGTIVCAGGHPIRFHDLRFDQDGSVWLMCDDTRTMDLSSLGGNAAAQVTATMVQHLSASGAVLFEWNAFDHFAITDLDSVSRAGPAVNFTHGNSFDVDTDGNLLISFRSLSEITRVNTTTGAVIWRMGGPQGTFAFAGSPGPGFSRQHNLRVVGPNRFIILDNTGGPDSRYERYLWDAGTMTATLEQSYGAVPGVTTAIGGSVQHAGPGRWLVSFGTQGRVEEFDDAGTRLWQIDGNPGYVFRAQRIPSLYAPGVGAGR